MPIVVFILLLYVYFYRFIEIFAPLAIILICMDINQFVENSLDDSVGPFYNCIASRSMWDRIRPADVQFV